MWYSIFNGALEVMSEWLNSMSFYNKGECVDRDDWMRMLTFMVHQEQIAEQVYILYMLLITFEEKKKEKTPQILLVKM